MSLVYSAMTDLEIQCPAGRVKISLGMDGLVVVEGSEERRRERWYWDRLKQAKECVKRGGIWRHSKKMGCWVIRWSDMVLHSDQRLSQRMMLKMIEAAEDVVRRDSPEKELPVPKGEVPIGNGLVVRM